MSAPLLKAVDLRWSSKGSFVLDIPSFEVMKGEVLVILGQSGSGKTTLLRFLGLLDRPERGRIIWEGLNVTSARDFLKVRRKMALVQQKPCLFDMTVNENVAYGLAIRKTGREIMDRKVKEAMKLLHIEYLAGRGIMALSGGEAHRVSLARALVTEPELLLIDEPFLSLDYSLKAHLRQELKRILRESRMTALYITHERNDALFMADRVAVMVGGKIVQSGTAAEVFNRPSSLEVAKSVGFETVCEGTVVSSREGLLDIRVGSSLIQAVSSEISSGDVFVTIRPEEVVLARGERKDTISARNCIVGKVNSVEPQSAMCRVSVDAGFPLVAYITKQSQEEMNLQTDDIVTSMFKAHSVHVIER
ncbi:MAG: ABC transporter ATP-binding protein [Candidatus Xenobiia bacterium LiM19]